MVSSGKTVLFQPASLPEFEEMRGKRNLSFLSKLEQAEKSGFLANKGLAKDLIMGKWQRDNVRWLLGVRLNGLEVRCSEVGGDYEFEVAKCNFNYSAQTCY